MLGQLNDIRRSLGSYVSESKELKNDIKLFELEVQKYLEEHLLDKAQSKERNRASLDALHGSIYESAKKLLFEFNYYANAADFCIDDRLKKIDAKFSTYVKKYENLTEEERQEIRFNLSYLKFLNSFGLFELIGRDNELRYSLASTKKQAIQIVDPTLSKFQNKASEAKETVTTVLAPYTQKATKKINHGAKVMVKIFKKIENKTNLENES